MVACTRRIAPASLGTKATGFGTARVDHAAWCMPSPKARTPGINHLVAYDEALAERIRVLVAGEAGVTEQKMFGGLAFLVGGNMAIAASGEGGVLVRVDPERFDALVATTGARPMEMRGREMRGWLRVDAGDVKTKRQLEKWVERGTEYARSLPAKR
jgi:hypothetical protein